jgi:hypothetical protein
MNKKLFIIVITIFVTLFYNQLCYAKEINFKGKIFNINDKLETELKTKKPTLIQLILNTESMDDEERQFWFDKMQNMTEAQIDRLFIILETERKKLEELELKYQEEIKNLNTKYIKEFQITSYKSLYKNKENNINKLYYAQESNSLGQRFELKEIVADKKNDLKHFLSLKELLEFHKREELSISDELLLINFSKQIVENLNNYEKIYGVELISEFLCTSIWTAYKYDDKELIDSIAGKIENNTIKTNNESTKNKILLNYYIYCNKVNKALEIYDKELTKPIDNIENWVYCLARISQIFQFTENTKYKENSRKIIKKYINLITKNDSTLDKAVYKGDTQTRMIILDILIYIYSDLVSKEQKERVKYYIKKNYDKEEYFKNNPNYGKWYLELNSKYFNENLEGIFKNYIHDLDKGNNQGYMLDGIIMETGAYYAYQLIKNEEYGKAEDVLKKISLFGNSFKSPAKMYIEKDIIVALQNYINQKNIITEKLYRLIVRLISKENLVNTLTFVGTVLVFLMLIIAALFPYARIFRNELSKNLFFNHIMMIVLAPIMIKRIFSYCIKKSDFKISFFPLPNKISNNEFLSKYIPISLKEIDKYVHTTVVEHFKIGYSVALQGDGGMGKTLSAHKIASEMQKDGYLPVFIETMEIVETVTRENISSLIGLVFQDNDTINLLDKSGFKKYLFIFDNLNVNASCQMFEKIKGLYPECKILITTRSTQLQNTVELYLELNAETVDFSKFLEDSCEERAEIYKTFILELKNVLLISIIFSNNIDLVDIIRAEDDVKQKILEKYIEHQIDRIYKKRISSISEKHAKYFIEELIKKIASSPSYPITIQEFLDLIQLSLNSGNYFKEIYETLKGKGLIKNNLDIIDLFEGSAIIVFTDSNKKIKFSHDMIWESILNQN